MARFSRIIGRNKDIPQLESYSGTAVSGGTANDFEHIIATVPDLSVGASSGSVGDLPSNTMTVRLAYLVFEAVLTGATTHTCTFFFRQYRSGALVATTTASTAVPSAGPATITPASTSGIFVGQYLNISGGTGTAETVQVTAVTSTTFTATFANTHSGTYNIAQAPLASVAFITGTNAAAYTPIMLSVPRNSNAIKGGDVLTIQRVSNDATGLATPAYLAGIDWVASGVG